MGTDDRKVKAGAILEHRDGSIYIALENGDAVTVYEASSMIRSNNRDGIQIGMADSDNVRVIGYIDGEVPLDSVGDKR